MKYKTREDIKKNIKYGDYKLIAIMLKGKYKSSTIEAMINNRRTLKKDVIRTANKLIISREKLLK